MSTALHLIRISNKEVKRLNKIIESENRDEHLAWNEEVMYIKNPDLQRTDIEYYWEVLTWLLSPTKRVESGSFFTGDDTKIGADIFAAFFTPKEEYRHPLQGEDGSYLLPSSLIEKVDTELNMITEKQIRASYDIELMDQANLYNFYKGLQPSAVLSDLKELKKFIAKAASSKQQMLIYYF